MESELFGHVRGAFTGAHQTRIGKFEQADKGTMFLDEIGNMSPTLQVKLLRVLQEREFERIGGSDTVKVDVRIIAATSANLKDMANGNEFRRDLYYRLNVIPIRLPPLRERKEDIPSLTQHFLRKFCQDTNLGLKTVNQEAMKIDIPEEGINFYTQVSQLERELILQSLKKSGGNKKQAAKLLNLKRTTLIEKLKRLNLTDYMRADS